VSEKLARGVVCCSQRLLGWTEKQQSTIKCSREELCRTNGTTQRGPRTLLASHHPFASTVSTNKSQTKETSMNQPVPGIAAIIVDIGVLREADESPNQQ
jgi:hypothetical protein